MSPYYLLIVLSLLFCPIFATDNTSSIENCNTYNSSNCFSCNIGFYLQNNQCNICSSSCLKCSGPNENNCLSCSEGNFLSNGSCKACDLSCNTCNSSQTCLSCNINGVLTANNTCSYKCDQSCSSCYGTLPTNCLTCGSNVLYKGQCMKPGCPSHCSDCYNVSNSINICLECLDGFYLPSSCLPCSTICKTCQGDTVNDCLSCNDGFYLNKNTNSCSACYYSCKKCYGGQFGSCSECLDGYYLVESACSICNTTCQTCFGPNDNHCLSCNSDKTYEASSRTCVSKENNSTNATIISEEESKLNYNALIISLSVIFGIMLIIVVILSFCYLKEKKKVSELKYIQNEILSKKSSVKLSDIHQSKIPSLVNIQELKKEPIPMEDNDLIKKWEDIEKNYENQ